jgi:GNAT superfamily N-acetyltransferase
MLDYAGGIEAGIKYYHTMWGSKDNYPFFKDAILHSTRGPKGLPRFYLLLKQEAIVGCIALVTNDFISRDDLCPWVAGIYVKKSERGRALGNFMMRHVENEAKAAGYNCVYLTTDHDGYYEKYGWTRMEDGYDWSGKPSRIYRKAL